MTTQVETPDSPPATRPRPTTPGPASEATPEPAVVRIRPPRGWQPVNAAELWRFRELIFFLAWRDVKVRYKQTALGVAWAVLQPAMMMVVFTVFFGRMANVKFTGDHYPVFVLAGLLPWTFFATALTAAANSVVGSERLISKVYFPRLAVPFAAVGASAVDFFMSIGLLGVLMLWYGVAPGAYLWLVPLIFLVLALVAAGAGTFLAALNVQYRDFRYVIPFLVQIGMFATPTVYMQPDPAAAGGTARLLLALNPLSGLVDAFRVACLGGTPEHPMPWGALAGATAFAAAIFLGGCYFFRRAEARFADII
jgi:lipopolysaccharide transport system permease protein